MKLMAMLAHPDDESFGVGGTLAKYAAEGVEVSVVTATRGDRGRFRGRPVGDTDHPGADALGRIREQELRAAAAILGVRHVCVLGFHDQELDRVDPREGVRRIVRELRSFRPDVVLTFGPDGAYGHPDHIAISQLTTAAAVAAANAAFMPDDAAPHSVSKLYYIAWPQSAWTGYERAVNKLSCHVDGVDRHATPWPDWAITTVIDARSVWPSVWRAVACHDSQIAGYGRIKDLTPAQHQELWGVQSFYRVFSSVNGGRARETDLFAGVLEC
jgi:LmbE family N-acetylglucosaminyl deacetylase